MIYVLIYWMNNKKKWNCRVKRKWESPTTASDGGLVESLTVHPGK